MISKKLLEEIHKIKKYYSLETESLNIISSSECAVYWDKINNEYKVEINRNYVDYFLIHELGHIFFSNIIQYPYFVKFSSSIEKVNEEIRQFSDKNPFTDIDDFPNDLREFRVIHDFSNSILDSFVNYKTFIEKEEYIQFYINYIKEIIKIIKQGFKPGKLRILLPSYINFYLEFNYNINAEEEYFDIKQDIDDFLIGLKNVILKSKVFTLTQFKSLNKILDNFIEIKDTNEYSIIVNFIYKILLNLSLWNEDVLKEKLAKIYPNVF